MGCVKNDLANIGFNKQIFSKKFTILIVEDDISWCQTVKHVLGKRHKLIFSETGEQALEIIDSHRNKIDVILLDLDLPDMQGIEILKYVKKQKMDIEVVINSAIDSSERTLKCLELEAFYYILKSDILKLPFLVKQALTVKDLKLKYRNLSSKKSILPKLLSIA